MKVVVSEKSYSKKQIRKHRITKYSVVGALILLFITFFLYSIQPLINGTKLINVNSLLIIFSMTLGAVASLVSLWLFRKIDSFLNKTDIKIGIAMAGDKGEMMVFEELNKVLNENYTVYPNYIIPGHKFDLDFLIVGPKGLIVVEVKNFSNATFFSEDKALSIKEAGFKKEVTKLVGSSDPRTRIDTHCKVLNNYLNYLDFNNINIRKVLVFAKDHVTIEGKSNIYIVKKIYELGKYFESLYEDEKFTPEYCEEVNNKLSPKYKN